MVRKKRRRKPDRLWLLRALSIFVILLVMLLFVPLFIALSAGLASLSIIIYGVCLVLLTAMLQLHTLSRTIDRLLIVSALYACLAGLVIPQALFLQQADKTGATLAFDPVQYVHFSGSPSVQPSKTIPYKTLGSWKFNLAVYGNDASQKPTVVLLHGGGWRYGNYLETGIWPQSLINAGFTVVSVQYRLSSPNYPTWDRAPSDVHDALLYLRSHAMSLGVDPENITLLGQSAGGHLALLEAYKHHSVKSVVSLYAPTDLALDYKTSRDKSAELYFIGGSPQDFPDRYHELSPLTYISDSSPRTLIVQGARDDLVAEESALALISTLQRHAVPHKDILLPLTGHSFENQTGGFATQITRQAIIDFVNER